MNERKTTKACGRCGRHSWEVANGNPCMWCGYVAFKTPTSVRLAILAMVAIAVGFGGLVLWEMFS